MSHTIEILNLFVGDSAYAISGTRVSEKCTQFLRETDPWYFHRAGKSLVRSFASATKKESKSTASHTLRILHGQSIETLFAYIFGALQAPHCLLGWLQLYSPSVLRDLVRAVNERQKIDLLRMKVDPPDWFGVSRALNTVGGRSSSARESRHRAWAAMYQVLACDFLKDTHQGEYNGLKHGHRVASTAVQLSVGKEKTLGVPAAKMHILGAAEHAGIFQLLQKPSTAPKSTHVRHLRNIVVTWDVNQIKTRLHVVSIAIHNIVVALNAIDRGGIDTATTYTVTMRDVRRVQHNSSGFGGWSLDVTPDFRPTDEPDRESLVEEYKTKLILMEEKTDKTRKNVP